ncbi:MAG: hypothetical protein AB7E31_16120 [Desulfitobacterium sp.]
MKRLSRAALSALLAITLILSFTGCSQNAATPKEDPKANQTEKPDSSTKPPSDPATPTDKKPAVEEENCNC